METTKLNELIEESIRLELNAAELYKIFSETLPEDNEFWWQLHLEEKSHATLIRAARDSFVKRDKFPHELIASSIEELKSSNSKVEDMIVQFRKDPPDRNAACKAALKLENESGELHYTRFMEREANSGIETVFQHLNRGDKEHEKRIRAYCQSTGLEA